MAKTTVSSKQLGRFRVELSIKFQSSGIIWIVSSYSTMDISSNEEEEIFSHTKRVKKSHEENHDFFSDLPDSILVHILSFLPLRDAIRTVVLPRFGKLWLSLPVLDLDHCTYHEYDEDADEEICDYENFMHVVHKVWNHQDENTLDKLHLRFALLLSYSHYTECDLNNPNVSDYERRKVEKERAALYQVGKLISYAVSRKVKVLDIDLKGCEFIEQYYELPDVLSTGYLTNLQLAACDIRSCEQINLSALRVLFLHRVLLSDEAIERILNGCPFLEDLSVVDCHGFRQLNSKNPNLKKLMLCVAVNSWIVFVECPHVVSIEISGWIDGVFLHHVSSLVEASVHYSYLFKCKDKDYSLVRVLLYMVRWCRTFSICTWSILNELLKEYFQDMMSICKLKNFFCPQFQWKHIKVELDLSKWHLPGLFLLLRRSTSLVTVKKGATLAGGVDKTLVQIRRSPEKKGKDGAKTARNPRSVFNWGFSISPSPEAAGRLINYICEVDLNTFVTVIVSSVLCFASNHLILHFSLFCVEISIKFQSSGIIWIISSYSTMDISSSEEDEIFSLTKRVKKFHEENHDFFSDLPDPILVHILSFLPLRDAIRTVLLPRFGKLWLSLPVLDLDNCVYHEDDENTDVVICDYENFMHVVHQVWNHHENTLDKLHLRFALAQSYAHYTESDLNNPNLSDYERRKVDKERAALYQVGKLIGYAVSRKVKVLDLDLKGCDYIEQYYELPDVLSTGYLMNLRLVACKIRSCEQINLPALRVLSLHKVFLSDEAMERILNGCPFLEDLSLFECRGFRQLNSKNPNLKKLMLSLAWNNWVVAVQCPHVVSIEISGWIEGVRLPIKDRNHFSSLVEASIYYSSFFRGWDKPYSRLRVLLFMVRRCRTFSICAWSILVLSICKLKNLFCPQFKWKHIKVKLHLTKWDLPGLSFLLKLSSSSLVELTMLTLGQNDSFFKTVYTRWIWEYDFDGEGYLNSQKATLPYLESIRIHSCHIRDPYFIQIVKFLLKITPRLQKMVISTEKEFTSEQQLFELSEELSTSPRASLEALVCIS
ncbi:F-box family protein [Striga asiatica]|uniref:F-box family protein n=1 Tax=Striga asiatica TaxID=4170 RepID=A0A5A7Q9C1_STRAF|nr:F-box family protein [Striga asiatica]